MSDYFEICNELEKINKEYDNNTDFSKVEYYRKKIDELEKEKNAALDLLNQDILRKAEEKEEKFKKIDFSKEPYFLMNYCRDAIWYGKIDYLNTDDISYGNLEKIIPTDWSLEKYFEVMQELEELFNHLSNFQIDTSDYFPEQKLYIRLPVDEQIEKDCGEFDLCCRCSNIIEMRYIIGQGSDFSIGLIASEKEFEEFTLDWKDAVKLSKMNSFEQAKWYVNYLFKTKKVDTDKLYFLLGQATTKIGFIEMYKRYQVESN